MALRLKQLKVGPIEAATGAGIERTFIRDLIKPDGKRSIRSDKMDGLARALFLDPQALAKGELVPSDDAPDYETGLREKPAPPSGDIQNLTIDTGAGGGRSLSVEFDDEGDLIDPAMSDGFWSFPEVIKAGWRNMPKVYAMPVTGDSMEPTLAKGSTVFVDTSHTHPNPEDIYAVDVGDGLVVKRLKLVPRSNKIMVISDNAERYGAPDELLREDVRVYGRVVAWFQWRG